MPSDGNKEEEEGDGNVIILCSTDVEQVVPRVRRNENSPKIHPVEQRVPPILGVPNVGRNVSSHSVLSRSTYQTVPKELDFPLVDLIILPSISSPFFTCKQVIIEMTGGGADYCSECDGLASLVKEAYACIRKATIICPHYALKYYRSFELQGWGETFMVGIVASQGQR
ncbi:hypothetical protein ACFX19_043052 [Malus domestica]